MQKHYKIVHCGIFNEKDNGNFFYGLERKISHGLIQNGHFVYDFSYRDVERNSRFLGLKDSGLKKMNKKLIDMMVEMDGVEFIDYKEFRLNLELWLAVYTELIGIWFGEDSRNQIAELLMEYGSTF